ncbi:hypothetical protein BDW72DRAFT_118182 [Aspergillus terricola var. indicus]
MASCVLYRSFMMIFTALLTTVRPGVSSILSGFCFSVPPGWWIRFTFSSKKCPWSIVYTPSCLDYLISNLCFQSRLRRCGGCPGRSTLFAFLRDLAARLLPFFLLFLSLFFFNFSFPRCVSLFPFGFILHLKKVHLVHESCDTVFAILNVCFPYLPVVNSTQRPA